MEVLNAPNRESELERQRYLERQRVERDAASLAADARVARQEGQRIGRIQLLQQLLAQPETSSEELGRLPEPDLLQLEESLKRQLSSPKQANGLTPSDKT